MFGRILTFLAQPKRVRAENNSTFLCVARSLPGSAALEEGGSAWPEALPGNVKITHNT